MPARHAAILAAHTRRTEIGMLIAVVALGIMAGSAIAGAPDLGGSSHQTPVRTLGASDTGDDLPDTAITTAT